MRNDTIAGVLSKVKWTASAEELKEYVVVVIDRGKDTGLSEIRLGEDVIILRDRLIVGSKTIPIHRVVEIRRGDEVIWRRSASARK